MTIHPRCVLDNKNRRKSSQTQKVIYCSVNSTTRFGLRRLCKQLHGNGGSIL